MKIQRFIKSRTSLLAPTLVLICVLLHHKSYSQYILPKPRVLVENNIGVIHITKTPLRKENSEKRDVSENSFDRTPQLLSSYFISHTGQIDSVFRYYHDTSKYSTQIFLFSSDNRLQETLLLNPEKEVLSRTLLEGTSNNELHLQTWSQGVLTYELKVNSDSIIYEITSFDSFYPIVRTTKTIYDLDQETMTKSRYSGEDLVVEETYQWIAQKGVPHYFYYTKLIFEEGSEIPTAETLQYEVASDGSIMSENKGLFTDPFSSFNYFKWKEHYTGMQHPLSNLLRAESLVSDREDSEAIDFEGSTIVYEYSMNYLKNN